MAIVITNDCPITAAKAKTEQSLVTTLDIRSKCVMSRYNKDECYSFYKRLVQR